MSSRREWLERLVDTLLREEVGGEHPPDLTERVMAAIGPQPKTPRRRRWLWAAVGAVAVILVVGVGVALFGPREELIASGVTVDGGGPVVRGATVRTAGDKGQFALGGYCTVELQPNTTVRIEGTTNDERVTLLSGEVTCTVQPNRGEFEVVTPQGRVKVSGTRFGVQLQPGRTPDGRAAEWTVVQVEEGSVTAVGAWGEAALSAGDQRRFPPPADPFAARIAALKPDDRAEAVVQRLKELNPGFDGRYRSRVAEGEVRNLAFATDDVTDISPLKAVPHLWSIAATPSPGRRGKLRDLDPLTGHWELSSVEFADNPIDDLTPLAGKPLVAALLTNTKVSDLTPFRGGTVRVIHLNNCPIRDLSPLQGLKLTELGCVPDNRRELDLTPVADAPLERIWCVGPTGNNAAILRRMRSLTIVNDQPAAMMRGDL